MYVSALRLPRSMLAVATPLVPVTPVPTTSLPSLKVTVLPDRFVVPAFSVALSVAEPPKEPLPLTADTAVLAWFTTRSPLALDPA